MTPWIELLCWRKNVRVGASLKGLKGLWTPKLPGFLAFLRCRAVSTAQKVQKLKNCGEFSPAVKQVLELGVPI
jgi:hypothetical protein